MTNEKVYMIIDVKVNDPEIYRQYTEKARAVVEEYGGRYLVRGGKVTSITDNWNPERMVIIEFPSQEAVKKCFSSQEYKKIAPLRAASITSRAIIVEGA